MGALSRALAVATLRLELEYIAGTLEDEALDIAAGTLAPAFMLSRQVGGVDVARPTSRGPCPCWVVSVAHGLCWDCWDCWGRSNLQGC